MRWIEVTVNCTGDPDLMCADLAELGVGGMIVEDEQDFENFLENNHAYWDYVDEELENKFKGVSRVKFYLSDDEEGKALLNTVANFLGKMPETAFVQDSDWENNWKEFYKPIEVGEKLVVVPEWEPVPEDGRIPLKLDPGLIFGTGSHATTKMWPLWNPWQVPEKPFWTWAAAPEFWASVHCCWAATAAPAAILTRKHRKLPCPMPA